MMPSEDDLRTLVRDAVARRLGRSIEPGAPPFVGDSHPSHVLLPLARGGDGDGRCLIEPGVGCNHCGYCLSYGH